MGLWDTGKLWDRLTGFGYDLGSTRAYPIIRDRALWKHRDNGNIYTFEFNKPIRLEWHVVAIIGGYWKEIG